MFIDLLYIWLAIHRSKIMKKDTSENIMHTSGVARAFSGGRAHPEGQNEEENEKSLRKNKKN